MVRNKRKAFFEGWYFKQEKDGEAFAVIPAFHRDEAGELTASIQVITADQAYHMTFPASECCVSGKRLAVRIGKNFFSEKGLRIDLLMPDGTRIKGRITFGPFTPPAYDMMGPFRLIHSLQCNHGVLSMTHRVRGELSVGGTSMNFHGGRGYLEKDWGTSFPSYYLWCQCGWADSGECSLMISAADIPLAGMHFPGCIAFVWYGGKEYRLATYHGVRILKFTDREILLKQGKYRLSVRFAGQNAQELKAPQKGSMDRMIKENLVCRIWCRFWIGERLIFEHTGTGSGESVTGWKKISI